MAEILAVDGNSLAHRAWHALRDEAMEGPWVTHGVVRMLATAWAYGPFDAVVVALDAPTSLRREQDAGYKANRPPTDPELRAQIERMGELLEACGVSVLRADGYEADDLLAATARHATAAGVRCSLLSSDRDLLALVSDGVRLLRPRATMATITVYDPDGVRREFGVRPDQYLEFAALRGDTSDNLAGVNGVGARTAARLVASWGSIPAIYAGLRELPRPLAAALRDARDAVDRNLALMAPMDDHEVDVAAIVAAGLDVHLVEATLNAVGLYIAATSFRIAVTRGPAPPPAPPPIDDEPMIVLPPTPLIDGAEQPALFPL